MHENPTNIKFSRGRGAA